MVLKLFNTLGRREEEFRSLKEREVSFYYCGPTVYSKQHIGNLRGAFCADTIRRSLEYLGYKVNFVSNYTDVGHLTSDEDEGEDKIEKGSKQEGLSPAEIANKYIKIYEVDIKDLNILQPLIRCRATNYIEEMIEMIQKLFDKGFVYQTELAVYFDVSKADNYTQLSGQTIEDLKLGAGSGDVLDKQKRNISDFAVWFFKAGVHENALQTWNSPWGEGFPGWHIECSAMVKKHLGETIDLHMGGIEHIPTHHTNEIAQSESANGVKFTNYWLHNEHLGIDGTKMSKSLGNVVYIEDIKKKGFNPLALRFFFLQANYRSKQNFTWEALESAQNGYENLFTSLSKLGDKVGQVSEEYKNKFIEKISDDFNLSQALALVFEVLKSDLPDKDKLATVLDFDKVLGLDLEKSSQTEKSIVLEDLPQEIKDLVQNREKARAEKDWQKSDELRDEIQTKGYLIKDTSEGVQVFRK
ncbi:MAG: cysteine--tRNA ligase [Patescibacteria group bacterium]|nr:cysteine--tRNA ligase [Patescibacteria group bacterium]